MSDENAIGFEYLNEIGIEQSAIPVKLTVNGKTHEVIIRQLADIGDVLDLSEITDKREKAFTTLKNKMMITVPEAAIKGYESRFKGMNKLNDGKIEFPISKKDEIEVATTLEFGIIDLDGRGKLTFNQAVVLARLNFVLVSKIAEQFKKVNQEMIAEQAKND